MDFNNITLPDLAVLTQEDLQHKCTNLFHQYQQLKQVHDNGTSQSKKIKQKHSREIEDFKNKYSDLVVENTQLEHVIDGLKKQIENLRGNINPLKLVQPQKAESVAVTEKEMLPEKENLDLQAKIDSHGKVQNSLIAVAAHERKIDIYGEQIQCLQENLNSKRLELDKKTNLLESAQERVAELNSELISFKSARVNGNRKENSLYVEVDNRRKPMKKLLQVQEKCFLDLQKRFNDSEQEIRKLRRENAAIQKDLQICISTFVSAHKIYKDNLEQRRQELLKRTEGLEKQLKWACDKYMNESNEKDFDFVFCKNELHELKTQYSRCLMQKDTLENSLRIILRIKQKCQKMKN